MRKKTNIFIILKNYLVIFKKIIKNNLKVNLEKN